MTHLNSNGIVYSIHIV